MPHPTARLLLPILLAVPGPLAAAHSGGFARFAQGSDTIRILGNTVFQNAYTYEMRIWIEPGSPREGVLHEQRDTTEDKSILVGDGRYFASICWPHPSVDAPIIEAGRWIHLADVRSGNLRRLFVDGALAGEWIQQSCFGNPSDSWMSIGSFVYGAGWFPGPWFPSFLGRLDWIRISSVARYTAPFVPPKECDLVSDAQTNLLLRFNEGPGTSVLIDESPNAFVCQLGVPVTAGFPASAPSLELGGPDAYPPCGTCPGDFDEDGAIDADDIALVLGNWGATNPKTAAFDLDADGHLDGNDLAILLASWGRCR